jgi:hypothetical protein
MKTRYWNRREFDVAQNGYFTVLKPSGWFSAARLPDTFRYLFKGAPAPKPMIRPDAESSGPGLPPQILPPSTREPLLRIAFIILAAAAITALALRLLFHVDRFGV